MIQSSQPLAPRTIQALNGTWDIVFDEKNEGKRGKWWLQERFMALEQRQSIKVPSCWETLKKDYEGVAFYGHSFKSKALGKDQTAYLQFAAVNYIAEVWLNDTCLGRHEGGYGPFDFEVGDVLKDGDNFVSLRVLGPIVAEDKEIDGLGRNDMPHWRGAIAGGIWQGVQLLVCHPICVEDLQIIPHLDTSSAEVKGHLYNGTMKTTSLEALVEIRSDSDEKACVHASLQVELTPGRSSFQTQLSIPDLQLWSMKTPHLYRARITLKSPAPIDAQEVRFGMRELSLSERGPVFNGEPIVIKAAFFEALYPEGLAYPDSEAMARKEIELARDAGFNMIRPWRKPPPPMWLDLCDEMGMMVVGGLPIECMDQWPTVTPGLRERVMNEIRSAITRDRNRACMVQWEIFNEIWRTELRRLKHEASILARELDPSRLILDESGGFAGGANLYLPHSLEPVTFNDVHIYPGAPLSQASVEQQFLALAQTDAQVAAMGLDPNKVKNPHAKPGQLTFVSEIGYGSLPDLEDNNRRFEQLGNAITPANRYHRMLAESFTASIEQAGMSSIYPNLQDFCLEQQERHGQANRDMIHAIRCNDQTCGYAVHALTDGDWVLGAGLIDLFRQPKKPYHYVKAANAPQLICVRCRDRNVYAQRGTQLIVTGVNDESPISGKLHIEALNSQGEVLWSYNSEAHLSSGVSHLYQEQFKTNDMSGLVQLTASWSNSQGDTFTGNFDIRVFTDEDFNKGKSKVAIIDSKQDLSDKIKTWGYEVEAFSPETTLETPILVADVSENIPVENFQQLTDFIQRGGRVVYLEVLQRATDSYWSAEALPEGVLPIRAEKKHGLGLWVGVSHVVKAHPIFDGLPSNQSMDATYENVWSPFGLTGIEGEHIVAAISHGYHSDNTLQQHHQGPEPAWHSMDLGEIKIGRGKAILSALRLVDKLDRDPVADKIINNMLHWLVKA